MPSPTLAPLPQNNQAANYQVADAAYEGLFGRAPAAPAAAVASATQLLAPDVVSLSPEGLLLYLETRLNSLDSRIDAIFEKQQKNEYLRKQLVELQKTLAMLDENTDDPDKELQLPVDEHGQFIDVMARIEENIEAIKLEDPLLAKRIKDDLSLDGQILDGNKESDTLAEIEYRGIEVKHSKDYLQGLSKELETGAQLDMMQIQSLMSTRQTAIQLATGMMASFYDSQKSIVSNIR